MKSRSLKMGVAALCASSMLSGCVTNGGTPSFLSTTPGANGECNYNDAAYVIGGVILGAGLGLLLGGDKHRGEAAVAGGALGGLAGKGLQSYLQSRCMEIAEAQKRMTVTQVNAQPIIAPSAGSWVNPDAQSAQGEEGLAVTVSSVAMFDTGSPIPTAIAAKDLRELAKTYAGKNRKVLIVGHTDATGSDALNRDLSEKRAREVAKIFADSGVGKADLYYKGAGADRPIATNQTVEGRAANRRVEVVELATESGIIAYDSFVESDPGLPARVAASRNIPDAPTPPAKSSGGNTAPAAPQPPAAKSAPAGNANPDEKISVALKPGSPIDFGGISIDQQDINLADSLQKPDQDQGVFASLWPISSANAAADDPMLGTTCINDSYRPVGELKSLSDDQPVHRTTDYVPGLYSTSWHDTVNHHLVGLAKVAVLKDSGLSPSQPDFLVFTDYAQGDQKPAINSKADARSYAGKNGVFYRMFLNEDAWPARCVDVFFPQGISKGKQAEARLYYDKNNTVFATAMHLQSAKAGEK